MNKLRLILAGGRGFLGGELVRHFSGLGWEIIILTRSPQPRTDGVREIAWDATTLGDWASTLDGATAVINLTGRTVDCRYTAKNRREIMDSRVNSTRILGTAIAQCAQPPRVWLNSSTATLYEHTFDAPHDESSRRLYASMDAKDAFSISVGYAWEKALTDAPTPQTRRVALRTSMVLGLSRNSVFPVLRRLVKFGLGGKMGNGRQFVSWIHAADFCRAAEWIINHEELSGPVNLCGPAPLPNTEMMRTFREVCHAPFGLPATAWMLEIGAVFLRTETELILKSRRVISKRLPDSGFTFQFQNFRAAIEDLERKFSSGLKQWRSVDV